MARKACCVVACVLFTFATFGFHPWSNFECGWAGAAVLAFGLLL